MRNRKVESSYRTVGRMLRALRRDFRPDVFDWYRQSLTWKQRDAYQAASGRKLPI